MPTLTPGYDGMLLVTVGSEIRDAITEARSIAKLRAAVGPCIDELTVFMFNNVMVSVGSASEVEIIYRDFLRAQNGYIPPFVGPYPNALLTQEEVEHDARIEAKNASLRTE